MNRAKLTRVILSLALVAVPVLAVATTSVEAATLQNVRDVISDSGLSADADHEISFVATSGVAAATNMVFTFENGFVLTGVSHTDMVLLAGACGSESARTLAGTASGTTWGVSVSGQLITITSDTDSITAGHCVILDVGGTNKITNPSTQNVYSLDIATALDTGGTLLAILPNVTAEVTVDQALTFTVTGNTGATCVTAADVNTSATAISFGSLVSNTFRTGCQNLTVSTNATGGYSVTVQQDGDLTSGSDTIAAGNCDGTCTFETQTAWTTNTNNGFGYCVDNVTGTDAVASVLCTAGATATFRTLGTLGANIPEIVMSNAGVVDTNAIQLNYKLSIPGDQPAGTYTNQIIYVASPTY